MWLLQGRFGQDTRIVQSKLLKYGETYAIGRKVPADIVVDSKFVSRIACSLTIGSLTKAQRSQIGARPSVSIRFEPNKSRKAFNIHKPDPANKNALSEISVPAQQDVQLEDGHSFTLTTTIALKLIWKPFAVCFAGKIKESTIQSHAESAHKLGIHLSPAKAKWKNSYTHLCVNQIKPTENVMSALIQARPIVTLAYIKQMLKLASLPRHDEQSLENDYNEPDSASFLPDADPGDFHGSTTIADQMRPSEARTAMFSGTTCVFFVVKNDEKEVAVYRNILSLGGAQVFCHDPSVEGLGNKAEFTRLLMSYKNRAISYRKSSNTVGTREAPDEGLVVLYNAIHEGECWRKACAIACANLQIAMPSSFHVLTNAICDGDVRSHLNVIPAAVVEDPGEAEAADGGQDEEMPSATGLTDPDVTRIEERSQPPPQDMVSDSPPEQPENGISKTAAPAEPMGPPALAVAEDEPPLATSTGRKPLRRRTNRTNILDEIYGSADAAPQADNIEPSKAPAKAESSHAISPVPETPSTSSAAVPSSVPPTPARRSASKLTRRTGGEKTKSRRSEIFDDLLMGSSVPNDSHGGTSALANESSLSTQGAIPRSKKYRIELDEEDKRQSQSVEPETSSLVAASRGRDWNSMDNSSGRGNAPRLESVPEDEAMNETSPSTGKKRGAATSNDGPARKRQRSQSATVKAEAVQAEATPAPGPTSHVIRSSTTRQGGVAQGEQPDVEPQFLQALSTHKSRRKKMDEFDDEFNQLKITKPVRDANAKQNAADEGLDEDFEAFRKLAEDELQMGVRGNFVQVDFVPLIVRKTKKVATNVDAGVPNFKKFRPKGQRASQASQRQPVTMQLTESVDYGIGNAYWKGGPVEERANKIVVDGDEVDLIEQPPTGRTQTKGSIHLALSDDSDDGMAAPAKGRGKGKKAVPIESEGEDSEIPIRPNLDLTDIDSDDADDSIMAPNARNRSSPIKGQRRGAKRTAQAAQLYISDDEGDDGNFAGFGASAAVRSRRGATATRSTQRRSRI